MDQALETVAKADEDRTRIRIMAKDRAALERDLKRMFRGRLGSTLKLRTEFSGRVHGNLEGG